jgi:uncharacterized protein YggE
MRLSRALVLVCGFVLADAVAAQRCDAQFFTGSRDSIPMVTATGSAVVPVTPDRAIVYASVVGRDSTGRGALAGASAIRDRAIASLTRLGIRPEQVAPWGFAMGAEERLGGVPRGDSYPAEAMTARWGVRVVVERMDRLDTVLAALAAAGIERTAHVGLEATRAADAERLATEQAVADARRQAEAMARGAGGRLGALVSLANYPQIGQLQGGDTRFFFSGGMERSVALNPSDASVRVLVHAAWRFLPN